MGQQRPVGAGPKNLLSRVSEGAPHWCPVSGYSVLGSVERERERERESVSVYTCSCILCLWPLVYVCVSFLHMWPCEFSLHGTKPLM